NLYPNLDWNWGMFGENLTVNGLDETKLVIGAIYKVGSALIQITEPREPCFKLGVKFGSQKVVKQFVNHGFPGTYVRVLEEGHVKTGDIFTLVEQGTNNLTTQQYYQLLFSKDKNQEHLTLAINNEDIRLKKIDKLRILIKYYFQLSLLLLFCSILKDLLLITLPFTQLYTPYPAMCYLKGFLNTKNMSSFQMDLGFEVILELFSK